MELNKSDFKYDKNVDFNDISLNIKKGAYKCIGLGSGRIVYDLRNGYVIKAAINRKGIAQNEAEYRIAVADKTNLFAKVTNVSEGFELIVMEKADKIKNISYVWEYFNVKNNKELYHIKELQDISSKYDLILVDLIRPVNWGKRNERPIIIDFGFTRDVRRRFYMPAFFRNFKR